jgi:hypothetical protein
LTYWQAGCQIVALNFQTFDRSMLLNHGFFMQNANSGYVIIFNGLDTQTYFE